MLLEKVLEGVLGGGVGEEAPKIRTVPMPRWPPLGFPLAPGYHKPRAEPVSRDSEQVIPGQGLAFLTSSKTFSLLCALCNSPLLSKVHIHFPQMSCLYLSRMGITMCTRGRKMKSKELSKKELEQ